MFPRWFTPSPDQFAKLDEDNNQPSLVNRDLYDDGGYAPSTDTQFVFLNKCHQTVSISDIQVSKIRQPALHGPIFVGQARLTDPDIANKGTGLTFNLDTSDPHAKLASGLDYPNGPPITIPAGETRVIDIGAIALHHAYKFSVVLTVVDGERVYSQTFNDGGQPFRLSALQPGVLKCEKVGCHPYAGYSRLYVGESANPWHNGTWPQENPKTWTPTRRAHARAHS
jgi:hypothetical protein